MKNLADAFDRGLLSHAADMGNFCHDSAWPGTNRLTNQP
jgi:hypothetical protein